MRCNFANVLRCRNLRLKLSSLSHKACAGARARAGACRVHPPLRHARELAMSQRFCEKKVHTPTCDSIRHIIGEK